MAWMDFKHIPAKQVMIAKVIEVLEEVEPNLWKVRVEHNWIGVPEIIEIAGEKPQEGEVLDLYPVPYEQWKEWTQGQ
jgi:hypothetical protein